MTRHRVARAVVVDGCLLPINRADTMQIDPRTGSNRDSYTYHVVDIDDLTPEEQADVTTHLLEIRQGRS